MKRIFIILGILLLLGITFLSFLMYRQVRAPGEQACTLEAKLCPDGSSVGRTGPNCEFAECPGTGETATTTGGGAGIAPYNSGVTGTILLGPTCPVVREPPDPACAEKPYATAVIVYRTGGTAPFAIGNSDENGEFRFTLPPGSYRIVAKGGTPLPSCGETNAAVVPEEYTEIELSCDTGIR